MRGYVDTRWGQLHYRASGPDPRDGGPVVVLFHESPRSSIVYEPIMATLGESVSAFAFDTPGFGLSDSAPEGATIPEYGAVLLEAIDALGVGGFVPVGMKTGAGLAVQVATLAGIERVDRIVVYATSEPDPAKSEFWAQNWAPELPVEADGGVLGYLWRKNVGLYGTDSPRDLLACVADTISNLDRYNSIYPTTFRYGPTSWQLRLALVAAGVEMTVVFPPSAQMTPDEPITFAHIPGTREVTMPVTGQFASRAPREFTAAILEVALR